MTEAPRDAVEHFTSGGKARSLLRNTAVSCFRLIVNPLLALKSGCLIHPLAFISGNVKIGRGAMVAKSRLIAYKGAIEIGEKTEIFSDCQIHAHADVKIGSWVIMARECAIVTTKHLFDDPGRKIKEQGEVYAGVVIEDDVWLGFRATILPGSRIGRGSVIGAGAVVAGDIPPMSVAVGVPAKVIRKRGGARPE